MNMIIGFKRGVFGKGAPYAFVCMSSMILIAIVAISALPCRGIQCGDPNEDMCSFLMLLMLLFILIMVGSAIRGVFMITDERGFHDN